MKRTPLFLLSAIILLGCFTGCAGTSLQPGNLPDQSSADQTGTVSDNSPGESPASSQISSDDKQESSAAEPQTSVQTSSASTPAASETNYNIRPAEWASVKWTQYSSPYFTLTIPEGWQVDWSGNSSELYWEARHPTNEILGLSNRDHLFMPMTYEAMVNCNGTAYMESGNLEDLFKIMFSNSAESFDVVSSCVPADYDRLQSLRPNDPIRDYRSLYAKFTTNGKKGEGLYSGVIMESKPVLVNGVNYGLWETNCLLTQYAPEGEFVDWAPILAAIIHSFRYTDYYFQEKNSTPDTESEVYNPDPVLEAFEQRSKEDTIRTEKYSDMIGEYERVYNNDTGEIYRAYNGFLQDIGPDQTTYSSITDSQYAEGYVGWIDKPGS